MYKRFSRSVLMFGFGLALACGATGCSRSASTLDKLEDRDPVLKRAQARKSEQDIDGAIELFNKALDRKPTLARAHLELGLLYDSQKQDYIRAIYHYERYLDLRPNAEKKKLIQDLINQARLSFAASLPHQPGGAVEQIAALKRQIELLNSQIEAQRKTPAPAAVSAKAPAATGTEPQPPKPIPAKPAVETYVIQSGDTLSSIATKMYKDSGKWKTIFDANRATLASPESVRVGQTLVIPR